MPSFRKALLSVVVGVTAIAALGVASLAAAPAPAPKLQSIQMASDIWLVAGSSWDGYPNMTDPLDCNVYLIDGGGGDLALVDVGGGFAVDKLLANIASTGHDPQGITKFVLTHAHIDHAGASEKLRVALGHPIKVIIQKAEEKWLSQPDHVENAARFSKVYAGDFTPTKPDLLVKSNDVIQVGTKTLRVVTTPGHTPGSICLVFSSADGPTLLTGDTIIGDQLMGKGQVGWLDGHWGSSPTAMLSSFKKLDKIVADEAIVLMLPGHGRPTKGTDAIRTGIVNGEDRLKMLLAIPNLGSMMPL
jgi:hydroxyacylglutathione hydrolase